MHASWKTAQAPAALLILVLAGVGCAAADDTEDPGISPSEGATAKAVEADAPAIAAAPPASGDVSVVINQNGWDDHDSSTSGGHHGQLGHHGCNGHHHGHGGHHHGGDDAPPAGPNAGPAPAPAPPPPPPPADQAPAMPRPGVT